MWKMKNKPRFILYVGKRREKTLHHKSNGQEMSTFPLTPPFYTILLLVFHESTTSSTHPTKIDLNKKWLPKQKTIQNFNIDAQGSRKPRNVNPPTWEI